MAAGSRDPVMVAAAQRAAAYRAAVARTDVLVGSTPAERLRERLARRPGGRRRLRTAWERSLPLAAFRLKLGVR